jgi:hypothetical protein
VSLSNTGYPPMLTADSTISRVVPAISDTMAAGRCAEDNHNGDYITSNIVYSGLDWLR